MTLAMRGLVVLGLLCGCAGHSGRGDASADPDAPPATPERAPTPSEIFAERADRLLDAHLASNPVRAVELGLHAYDGRLPDVSPEALAREAQALEQRIAELQAFDPSPLSEKQRAERAALLTTASWEHFDLVERRRPQRDPMFYLESLTPTPYVARAYAPAADRAKAVIALARATGPYLEHAASNLEEVLPRTFVDTGLLQAQGLVAFVRDDVLAAFAELEDAQLRGELETALRDMATALETFAGVLQERRRSADDSYALGAETLQQMLARSQGIDVPLERLREVFQADLDRNYAALVQAAKELDPKRSVRSVVAKVLREKPAADRVLAVAREQAEQMRQFVEERELVSIPPGQPAQVVETPPFLRWNIAFLDGAGPFENDALPSFYYITPPDPKWSRAKRSAYVPATVDLLFITIHEVWPGHFLHNLHIAQSDSRVLKSLWNYVTGEGWAHYTEQMMWEAGMSTDPRVRIGQLINALLRDVRALSAIGLHSGEMTVAQSKRLFMTKAFQDATSAEQQAVRGTFDPMYLSYTLGKLILLKLREDFTAARKASGEEPTLEAFHDAVLSYAGAPLPAIRAALLGPDAGEIL